MRWGRGSLSLLVVRRVGWAMSNGGQTANSQVRFRVSPPSQERHLLREQTDFVLLGRLNVVEPNPCNFALSNPHVDRLHVIGAEPRRSNS